jgi:NADP-dependent 3-hydroxy acid dehydrogenase YdfG
MLGHRNFSLDDQLAFAGLSGDRNPMHLDAVWARRTQAGAPAVHGMHLLLWVLDTLARSRDNLPQVCSLKSRFSNLVVIGDDAAVDLLEYDERRARLAVMVNQVTAAQIIVEFGGRRSKDPAPQAAPVPSAIPNVPLDMTFEQMQSSAGALHYATPASAAAAVFPAAARWIGAERASALCASSSLVGMVCPGLHSMYANLAVDLVEDQDTSDSLAFRVIFSDPRFRLFRMSVSGGGIAGTVECMARIPPVSQKTMRSLSGIVDPAEFLGSTALIVGGSRGLGELTAKLIASGGGKVLVTYSMGRSDAESVAADIASAGGECACLEYNVRAPAAQQLQGLAVAPTHLYYFATPVILRKQAQSYSPQRLREFLDFYVDGFWELIRYLHARNRELSVFYPSSVYVEETPRGMTEYAMAKSAGELLCGSLNETLAPLRIHVNRLPRLATDQTASNLPAETQSALDTLLPLVRVVQSGRNR